MPDSDTKCPRRIQGRNQDLIITPLMVELVMISPAFRRGVAEARAGKPPRFDIEAMDKEASYGWYYEKGRQFGIAAPRNLPIILPKRRQLNPKAVALYWQLGICR
jgi:hypothetical protein